MVISEREELLKITDKHEKREEELLKIIDKHEESSNHITDVFMKIIKELKEQKKQLTALKQEEDKIIEENEKKIKGVDHEVMKNKRKEQAYNEQKKIMSEVFLKMAEINKKHDQLDINTDKIILQLMTEIKRMEENKQK